MSQNAYKIVTHGLGPDNDLAGFLTLGLNVNPTFSGLATFEMDAKSRTNALDVDKREAMYLPSLILFEDNSVMLFESDVRAMWEIGDAGDKGKVKERLANLEVTR